RRSSGGWIKRKKRGAYTGKQRNSRSALTKCSGWSGKVSLPWDSTRRENRSEQLPLILDTVSPQALLTPPWYRGQPIGYLQRICSAVGVFEPSHQRTRHTIHTAIIVARFGPLNMVLLRLASCVMDCGAISSACPGHSLKPLPSSITIVCRRSSADTYG